MGLFRDDKNCTCNGCGRKFAYGDKWSPSFNEEVWKQIVDNLGLTEHEIRAAKKFNRLYQKWVRSGEPAGVTYLDEPDCHTYVCYECAEKALGRKLTREDLIGKHVPLNYEFEKHYFKDDQE